MICAKLVAMWWLGLPVATKHGGANGRKENWPQRGSRTRPARDDLGLGGPLVRRASPEGQAVAYVLKFRTTEGRQRWHTIGRHGAPWTPDTAREEAKRLLGEVVTGGDPAAAKSAKRERRDGR